MLFPYTYVPHKIEKMQEFIDFIFFSIWCKAPSNGTFGLHLFSSNAQLYEVMRSFFYDDSAGADFFYGYVERIYEQFSILPIYNRHAIRKLKRWYQKNNAIEHVCLDRQPMRLGRYSDINTINSELAIQLKGFFKEIYSNIKIAALKSKIGVIDDHYAEFAKINKFNKCPFCGLNDLLGQYHSKREAYDHYLPKAFYPFNSINFRNLVPACHHCNSSYKGSKDTAFTPRDPCGVQARRKLFYPYSTQPYKIDLKVTLQHADYTNLTPNDISLHFGPPELAEQIETWKDVYDIEERYQAKLCSGDARTWAVEVLDEWRWYEESNGKEGNMPNKYLRGVERHCTNSPYANINFLKCGFLKACDEAGMFKIRKSSIK